MKRNIQWHKVHVIVMKQAFSFFNIVIRKRNKRDIGKVNHIVKSALNGGNQFIPSNETNK